MHEFTVIRFESEELFAAIIKLFSSVNYPAIILVMHFK